MQFTGPTIYEPQFMKNNLLLFVSYFTVKYPTTLITKTKSQFEYMKTSTVKRDFRENQRFSAHKIIPDVIYWELELVNRRA